MTKSLPLKKSSSWNYPILRSRTGNGNRGVGGYFEIPPRAEKIWKIPPLEILGNFFEKPKKTEKIR